MQLTGLQTWPDRGKGREDEERDDGRAVNVGVSFDASPFEGSPLVRTRNPDVRTQISSIYRAFEQIS